MRIFFFDAIPKLKKWWFLKVSCIWNPMTYQWTILYSVTLKSIGLLSFWMDLLLMGDFVTSFFGHVENKHSLRVSAFSNVDIFHVKILKMSFINITTLLLRNLWVLGSCQAYSGGQRSSQILISTWNLNSISDHPGNWNDGLTSFI